MLLHKRISSSIILGPFRLHLQNLSECTHKRLDVPTPNSKHNHQIAFLARTSAHHRSILFDSHEVQLLESKALVKAFRYTKVKVTG